MKKFGTMALALVFLTGTVATAFAQTAKPGTHHNRKHKHKKKKPA